MIPVFKGMEVLYKNGNNYYGIIDGEIMTDKHGNLYLLKTSKIIKRTYFNQIIIAVLAITPNGVKGYNE